MGMQWWQALILGGAGGLSIQGLTFFHAVSRWEQARTTKAGRLKASPPPFTQFVDWKAHLITGAVRFTLGAGVAELFVLTGQVSQPFVALALGLSAPAILSQLGDLGIVYGGNPGHIDPGQTSTNGDQTPATQIIRTPRTHADIGVRSHAEETGHGS